MLAWTEQTSDGQPRPRWALSARDQKTSLAKESTGYFARLVCWLIQCALSRCPIRTFHYSTSEVRIMEKPGCSTSWTYHYAVNVPLKRTKGVVITRGMAPQTTMPRWRTEWRSTIVIGETSSTYLMPPNSHPVTVIKQSRHSSLNIMVCHPVVQEAFSRRQRNVSRRLFGANGRKERLLFKPLFCQSSRNCSPTYWVVKVSCTFWSVPKIVDCRTETISLRMHRFVCFVVRLGEPSLLRRFMFLWLMHLVQLSKFYTQWTYLLALK